jgi:hypothetical protein
VNLGERRCLFEGGGGGEVADADAAAAVVTAIGSSIAAAR